MSIDLRIPGDPESIWALTQWLDPKLKDPVNDLEKSLRKLADDSEDFWKGRSGDAFRQIVRELAKAIDPVDIYARDAAEVFRAYARRLERGRDRFADYADDAGRAGLIVSDSVIAAPIAPQQHVSVPGGPSSPADPSNAMCVAPNQRMFPYDEALKKYDQIAEKVGSWWADLELWVDEYIVPLMVQVISFDRLAALEQTLRAGRDVMQGFLVESVTHNWEGALGMLNESATAATAAYETHSSRLRSGNPKIAAAAIGQSKPELRAARNALNAEVKRIRVGTKIFPLVGPAIDVIAAGIDVMTGGSPSSAVVGVLGGAAGGAAAGALASGPPGWVLLTVSATAVLAGWGAQHLWESNVPLDVREAIDTGDFGYVFS